MSPILSPWFWAVVCVVALAVAYFLRETRRATEDPDEAELSAEWLAILRAMNDSPESDTPLFNELAARRALREFKALPEARS